MKILHVIGSVSPKRGGPSFAIWSICEALQQQGIEVHIATTDDDGVGGRLSVSHGRFVIEHNVPVIYFPRQTRFYAASLSLVRWLWRHVHEYDVVHTHALFTFAPIAGALAARSAEIPYVMRPLGALKQWAREKRRPFIKNISIKVIEGPLLHSAAAVHFTAYEEWQEAKEINISMKPFIQSLGFDLQKLLPTVSLDLFYREYPELEERTILLFLSRIDPVKGIEILLQSFKQAQLDYPEAVLIIAGTGEADYIQSLQKQAEKLGVNVVWLGFVIGEFKTALWHASDIFVLPSYSENFGIVVVEALTAKKPVIVSKGVAIHSEIAQAEAGIVVPVGDVQALAHAICSLLEDESQRTRMGRNGYQLAVQKYSLESMGEALSNLYARVAQGKL